ncbi:MAG: hypothetical protein HOV80_28325 [Polyangiaceae bacterium]|nr:hypothetical protein [Polyangiaceae bacterium]
MERRHAAIVSLGAAAALVAGACRDTIVGDSQDVANELCAVLQDCEPIDPICTDVVERFVSHSDPDTTDGFLAYHASHDCLVSCTNARGCRDVPPMCDAFGSACESEIECCGSTQGIANCVAGACCAPRGTPCPDSEACCGGEVCLNGRCGEDRCALVDEGCTRNTDCCSRLCQAGECAPRTCSDLDEACLVADDCCPTGGEPLRCVNGACANPPDECTACLPVDEPSLNCCIGTETPVCYQRVDGTSFCAADTPCSPAGVECGSNSDCCTGMCDDSFYPHCCLSEGAPCLTTIECCEGLTCNGTCTP